MTKDDIIKLAREAGFVEYELDDGTTNAFDVRYERFANLVAAAERDVLLRQIRHWGLTTLDIDLVAYIDAIRARGTT